MPTIVALPAFNDNYIWLIEENRKVWVVDPGDADVVISHIEEHDLIIEGVLVTHRHNDHIGGINKLLEQNPNVKVVGPKSPHIPQINTLVSEGQTIELLGLIFTVLEVPGHTVEHIAYYYQGDKNNPPILFCGDTLFAGGCGRIFDSTPEKLHHSLQRLSQLPEDTLVYCTHEYTLANLTFAVEVNPSNIVLKQRLDETKTRRNNNEITLPSILKLERETNPFLRYRDPEIIQKAIEKGAADESSANVFKTIREWKDNF